MSLLNDVTALVEKAAADFKSGAWGSLSKDVGEGFIKLGDLLQTFVGFRAGSPEEAALVAKACAAVAACEVPTEVGAAPEGVNPLQWLLALQKLAETLKSIWDIFNPTPA